MKKFFSYLKEKDEKNVNFLNTLAIVFTVIALIALLAIPAFSNVYPYQVDIIIWIGLPMVALAFGCGIFFCVYDMYLTRESCKKRFPAELTSYINEFNVEISDTEDCEVVIRFFNDEIARLKTAYKKVPFVLEDSKEKLKDRIYKAKTVKRYATYCK